MVACPPDARRLEASDPGLQESALTGEADLVSRRPEPLLCPVTPGVERRNSRYPGTAVGLMLLYVAPLARFFGVCPLTALEPAACAGVSLVFVAYLELETLWSRRRPAPCWNSTPPPPA